MERESAQGRGRGGSDVWDRARLGEELVARPGSSQPQRVAGLPYLGEHGALPWTGRELSAGEMVGGSDGNAADIRRKIQRQSRGRSSTGTRGARAVQYQDAGGDQFLMRRLTLCMLVASMAIGGL